MTEIQRIIFGISLALSAQKGLISCPNAPPNGLARDITAVAATLPLSVNHKSLYRVGAASTNGWASPTSTWPKYTTPSVLVFVPAYLIQLPTSKSMEAMMMACLGPVWRTRRAKGAPTRKEKRKVVAIQFMAVRLVSKYSAEVVDTGA